MVPIPVGNLSTLIFPLDRAKDSYLLLSAQTNSLEGRIDYEEVKQVTETVLDIYRRGFGCRLLAYFFIKSFSYLLIFITFIFLIVLFLTLVRNAGIENLYILGGYIVALMLLFTANMAGSA